jgi:predicted nucleic acid-binding Zn ribbon protein
VDEIRCVNCGERVPRDADICPHCNAVPSFSKMARGKDPQRKFKIFFVLLVLFCLIMALWLPREL